MADEHLDIETRLRNKRQFIKDVGDEVAALELLRKKTDHVGDSTARTTRRGFLWNQAMFTARRLTYDFTLALGAAATAVAALGLRFDARMEQNQVALRFLLGSQEAANREIEYLFELAAQTPFAFADVTEVARKFISFGFSVDQTNRYLRATADAMAAMGGDPEVMNRIVRAFGQIQAKGRVMGEELLQLTEANIPALRYLQQELGLTGDQLGRIGELGIPANVAIEAIVRGMERVPAEGGFKGASEELSRTVTGQLATISDYAQQLFGEIMMAPFKAIRSELPQISGTLIAMTEAMRTGGFMAMVQAFDEGAGAGGRLVMAIEWLTRTVSGLAAIFSKGLWPALWANAQIILALLLPTLWALSYVLQAVGSISEYLAPVLAVLVFWWLAEKTATMVNTIWTRRNTAAKRLNRIWTLFLRREEQLLTLWRWASTRATMAQTFATRMYVTAMTWLNTQLTLANIRLKAAIITTWLFNAALWANPIVLIIAGIVALVGGLAILEYKYGVVSDALQRAWDKMRAFHKWLQDHDPRRWFDWLPGGGNFTLDLPSFAGGGVMGRSGLALVGERGPEIVALRGGSQVIPLDRGGFDWGSMPPLVAHIEPAPVNLDGRKVAEVVFKNKQDGDARR